MSEAHKTVKQVRDQHLASRSKEKTEFWVAKVGERFIVDKNGEFGYSNSVMEAISFSTEDVFLDFLNWACVDSHNEQVIGGECFLHPMHFLPFSEDTIKALDRLAEMEAALNE